MPVPWKIEETDDFKKEFKKIGSVEKKLCRRTIFDLGIAEDPRSLGIPKQTRRHGYCSTVHITGSITLVYRVFFQEEVIQMVTVGDHKRIYGKD